ncbi:MAG TPA: RNA polymerase sigma factor [Opitutaceae bacterium]|nr:RNA polymerase sigma factor [Opitutaceae bacterium]
MTDTEQRARFEAWVQEHMAILYRVANGFAEGDDRKDLMQEVLLAVWRAVPAFAGGSKPSTFIYKVAHNAALTWKRGASTYRRHVDLFEADVSLQPAAAEPAARDREALEFLYANIRRLAPVDRSLILLHLDGVSYASIAEIHGLTESNVGARLSRLRQKLSESMEDLTNELR